MKRHKPKAGAADDVELGDSRLPTEAAWRPESPAGPADAAGAVQSSPTPGGASLGGDPPSHIGPYEIEKELGRGGMGRVFLARQREPVERPVAVKVMATPGAALAAATARFEGEQQSLALAAHPNVAQIFDAGVTADGLPYLVMEYVPGQDLCSYARSRKLDLRARLRLFLPVCEAVQHAHRRGVIHRDLKPSNVLVFESGDKATPKVIDFGLAKLVDGSLNLTRGDAMLGTPGYMSPEQIFGETSAIDTRTDIYSLGALLYELLTDHTPFDVDRAHIARLFETVANHSPERPSRRVSQELASMLADDLDWVVLKALARDPDDRYGSVESLASDVRAVLDGHTVSARRPTPTYRLRKWANRHRAAVLTGAISLVVASAAVAWGAYGRWQKAQETRLAQRLGEEVARFESLLRFAHTIPLHDLRPTKAEILRRVEELEVELEGAEPSAVGPLSYAVGRGRLTLKEPGVARDVLRRAWESGYETPETALALGEALSELYGRQRDLAAMIRSQAQRQARLEQLDLEYRQPIVDWLERGRSASTGSAELAGARLALVEGRHDDVLRTVEQVLENRPWLYEALLLRAEVHQRDAQEARRRGDFAASLSREADSRAAYRAAARLGESDPEALAGECQVAIDTVLLDLRAPEPVADLETIASEGLEACRRAIEADPDRGQSWVQLAALHRFWGFNIIRKNREQDWSTELSAAIDAANRALELDPDDFEALLQLGRTHRELYRLERGGRHGGGLDASTVEHLEAAVDALGRASTLAQDHPAVANAATVAYSDLARHAEIEGLDAGPFYDRAAEEGRRYLDLAPGHLAYYNFGILMRMRSRWEMEQGRDPVPYLDRAIESYGQAIALNDNYPWADNNLGYAHLQRGLWLLANGGDPTADLDTAEAALLRSESLRDGLIDSSGNRAIINHHRGVWAWVQGEDPEPFWLRSLEGFSGVEAERLSDDYNIDPLWATMVGELLWAWADYRLEEGGDVATLIRDLRRTAAGARKQGREHEAFSVAMRAWLIETRLRVRDGDLEAARAAAERASAIRGPMLEAMPGNLAVEMLASHSSLWSARLAETDAEKLAHADAGLAVFTPRPTLASQALVEGELHLERACAGVASALEDARAQLERAVAISVNLETDAAPLLARAGSETGC